MSEKQLTDIPFSVLDLCPILDKGTPTDTFRNSLDLAMHAEGWGYRRYWLAEHHNMPGIASSATAVVIGHIAGGTSKMRVGSGGVMLPNHAPLVIAEQFGTLESLFPGRIDLGLGRAPGSDKYTAHALRQDPARDENQFSDQLTELFSYFSNDDPKERVRAIPGEGLNIPIWLLGSSDYSAKLAGQLGLPFAFASHISPDFTLPAIQIYRSNFKPSAYIKEPYVMVGMNVIVSETTEEAERLATSQFQQFLHLIRGKPSQLRPPIEDMDSTWSEHEQRSIKVKMNSSIIGSKQVVKDKLESFLHKTKANEFIINTQVYDHYARLHSYEILASIFKGD